MDTVIKQREYICVGLFSGDGGDICADFVPVDLSQEKEIFSEHAGTHMVEIKPGYITINGPNHTWTYKENWGQISAVLNHWPQQKTQDNSCANNLCEHDDWAIIHLR